RPTRWNKNFERVSGYSHEEIATRQGLGHLSSEDRAKIQLATNRVFEHDERVVVEYMMHTKDDREIPFLTHGERIILEGEPFLMGVGFDTSELKATQAALEDQLAFERWMAIASKRFLQVQAGHNIDQMIEETLAELGQLVCVDKVTITHIDQEQGHFYMSHEWSADGAKTLIGQLQSIPLSSMPWYIGELTAMRVVHIEDIDKVPNEALNDAKKFREQGIVSHLKVPIQVGNDARWYMGFALFDERRKWSDETAQRLRFAGEMLERAWERERTHRALQESEANFRELYISAEAQAKLLQETQAEQRRAEKALRQKHKLESLGMMSGGIAHDFNNMLTAMLAQASLARAVLPESSRAMRYVDKMVTSAERAAKLTEQLLAYSGRGHFDIRLVNLNQLLEDNLHLLEVALSKTILLELELADASLHIEADVTQIQQLIMNLVINAADAIERPSGHIKVTTNVIELSETRTFVSYDGELLPNGHYTCLEVDDNGCGISAEALSRIFDPFFTTKVSGHGLGLAAVLGIVRGHQGGLQVQSEVGVGTMFTLLFPMMEVEAVVVEDVVEEISAENVQGKVLVIDDEAPIRELVSDVLEFASIECITAVDGYDGIKQFNAYRQEIAVVLLDLSMPNLAGDETCRRLSEIDPTIPIILSSGYSETEIARRLPEIGAARFLNKPYRADELIAVIQETAIKQM
ncbi:MAG: ATP-binding protein, partial [Candidatus Promineifilaceae bacterium]